MRKIILVLSLISLLVSCNQSKKPVNESKSQNLVEESIYNSEDIKLADLLIDIPADSSMVFKVTKNCVFFSQFTTQECDSLENADPEAYEIFSENANNNSTDALELLKKLKIKSYWSDKRYISFNSDKKEYLIDTRIKNFVGNYCIMFRKDLKPEILKNDLLKEDVLLKYFKE